MRRRDAGQAAQSGGPRRFAENAKGRAERGCHGDAFHFLFARLKQPSGKIIALFHTRNTKIAGAIKNCPFLRRGSLWGIASPRSSVGEVRRGKFARGSIRGGERLKITPESGNLGALGGRKESGRGDCSLWKFQRVLGAISTTAINGSRRFAVPPVQSANFVSAGVAASGERPREDLGLNARSEGGKLSSKDGDEPFLRRACGKFRGVFPARGRLKRSFRPSVLWRNTSARGHLFLSSDNFLSLRRPQGCAGEMPAIGISTAGISRPQK